MLKMHEEGSTELRILGWVYTVLGALAAFSCGFLVLRAQAVDIAITTIVPGDHDSYFLVVEPFFFAVIAIIGLLCGALLRARRGYGLLLFLVFLNLLLIPFGTILGAATLWLLIGRDYRRLFRGMAAGQ